MANLGCGASYHPDWTNLDFVPHSKEVIQFDLKKELPFDDGVCAAVYHSHVLEHFTRSQARVFIQECFRILGPRGIMRVVVPDLETIARLYLENLEKATAGEATGGARHEWMTIELVDQLAREQAGGEMLKFWKQNPMPAEDFVIQRMGREVLRFLEYFRSLPSGKDSKAEPELPEDPVAVGKFRLSGEVHKWMYDRVSLQRLVAEAGFQQIEAKPADQSAIPAFNKFGLDLAPDGSIRKPDSLFMEAIK
jgi:SAM-dependent methyltransferase